MAGGGRKAEVETTTESGGSRVPLPVDGQEPLEGNLLRAGNEEGELPGGTESVWAAGKVLFPDEKGRLVEKPPEATR
jgi:hypothetical protein